MTESKKVNNNTKKSSLIARILFALISSPMLGIVSAFVFSFLGFHDYTSNGEAGSGWDILFYSYVGIGIWFVILIFIRKLAIHIPLVVISLIIYILMFTWK